MSIFDPDARPIRKGKFGKPNEFGYVTQICEVTENTKRGGHGLILPASSRIGNPRENTLLPHTIAELDRLGLTPGELALDGGFQPGPTSQTPHNLAPKRTFIAGRQQPGSPARNGALAATAPVPRAGLVISAQLRAAQNAPEGQVGNESLERLGHPHLQP